MRDYQHELAEGSKPRNGDPKLVQDEPHTAHAALQLPCAMDGDLKSDAAIEVDHYTCNHATKLDRSRDAPYWCKSIK
jgi:hypothetical protein